MPKQTCGRLVLLGEQCLGSLLLAASCEAEGGARLRLDTARFLATSASENAIAAFERSQY